MKIYDKHEYKRADLDKSIEDGSVFIYPTDTIYGIGCNALDVTAVAKIREIKKRDKEPFSIIAPSKEWITSNCLVTPQAEEWLEKLPGPYTLILKLVNESAVASNVSFSDTIGVRIPDHWFKVSVPIITTSVNISGESFMTDISELDSSISNKIDFAVVEGVKVGKPSTVVHLESDIVSVNRRT